MPIENARISRITVEGFKAFEDPATLRIAPLTLVLGRNASGKSLLSRLPLFISQGLDSDEHGLPLTVSGLSLGSSFLDLSPGRLPGNTLTIEVEFAGVAAGVLTVRMGPNHAPSTAQRIHDWRWAPLGGTPATWRCPPTSDRIEWEYRPSQASPITSPTTSA